MKSLCVFFLVIGTFSLVEGQTNCRVAASCMRGERSLVGLRRLPIVPVAPISVAKPMILPAMTFQKDAAASQNCKAPGWIIGVNGYQYRIVSSLATWGEARDICRAVGGSLPQKAFDTPESYEFLLALMKSNGDKPGFWLPLSDRAVEQQWRWDDNTPVNTNQYWGWNQPDGSGDCGWVARDQGYKWDDGACSATFTALCERKV